VLPQEEEEEVSAAVREPCRIQGSKEPRLECWTCHRTRLERLAVNWQTVIDFRYRRKLVFCSLTCQEEAKTKTGLFKMRRPRV
jgi:hypothetical protein